MHLHIHPCRTLGLPHNVAHILARQSPGIFHGAVKLTYTTEADCFQANISAVPPINIAAVPLITQPAHPLEPCDLTAFDPRVVFDASNHCYRLPGTNTTIPNSTLLASLVAPASSQFRFTTPSALKNGHLRHQAWALLVQNKTLSPYMTAKIGHDQSFLNVRKHILRVNTTCIRFILPEQPMLFAHKDSDTYVGVTADAPFVHIPSGEAGGFEWKSGGKAVGTRALSVRTSIHTSTHVHIHTSTHPHTYTSTLTGLA